jgi:hypothetical protein
MTTFGRLAVTCGAVAIGLVAGASQAHAVPGLVRTDATTVSDSSTSKTVAASCPAGKRVLGGGGDVTGGGGQVGLEQLQPDQTATDDRFVVGASEDETGLAGDWQLTAYALCADPLPGQQIVSNPVPATSNPLQSQLGICPSAHIGFGGRIDGGAGQVHLTDLFPFVFPPAVTYIRAQEEANGFDGLWSVTAYAVCADTAAEFTTVAATAPASSENKSATVSCPAGSQVHSAGGQVASAGSEPINGVVMDGISPDPTLSSVTVDAAEDETGTTGSWSVTAYAVCAA